MRIAKITIIFALLSIFVLVAVRFLLLDRLISYGLQKAGATDITVHVSDVGLNQFQLEVMDATFDLAGDDTLPVRLRNISFHYNLQRLLATGKCSRITIEEVQLERVRKSQNSTTRLQFPKQITLLQDELRKRLPFENLTIDHLQLQGDLPSQLTGRDIRVSADFKDRAIAANVLLEEDASTSLVMDVQSPDSSHATADIVGRQHQTEIIVASVVLHPKELSGNISLKLEPVRDLLLHNAGIPELPEVSGSMDGTFRLPLPLQDNSEVITKITVKDTANHKLVVSAAGNPGTQKADMTIVGQLKEQKFLSASVTLAAKGVKGTCSFQASPLLTFIKPYLKTITLPDVNGTFNGRLDIPRVLDGDHSFSLNGEVDSLAFSSLSSDSVQVQLVGRFAGNVLNLGRKSWIHAINVGLGDNRIQKISLDLAGIFTKKDEQVQLEFSEQQILAVTGLTTEKFHVKNLLLHPENPLQLAIHGNSLTVLPNVFSTTDPVQILLGENSCDIKSLTCRVSQLEKSGSGIELLADFKMAAAILKLKERQLHLKDLSGVLQMRDEKITGTLQLFPETIPGRMKAVFEHDLTTASGSYTLKTDRRLDLSEDGMTLANMLTPWRLPFNLESGKVSFKAGGSWSTNTKMQLSAFVTITSGSGFYKQFLFNGLDIRQDLAVLPQLHSKTEGSFSLQQLIGGIDIHDIHANVNFVPVDSGSLPLIELNDFKAFLFDGTVSFPGVRYDLNQPDSNFMVQVKDVNLKSLVDLVKMDSLHVSGKISGDIPVSIKGKEISVDHGELYSESPGGEIRYTSADMGQSGVTGYALKAVENLQYNSLKVIAKYQPSGQLDLDIGLKGTSPELETSRPVHLNIHAEQNLPALLQSLRFSKGLTEELDKRIKQHYN